jgi:acyl carrier protein
MTSAVEQQVKSIIVKQLNVKEGDISLEKSFMDDLGADSLDVVELVMAIEDAFDVEIPENDAESIRTVGDAIKFITSATAKA